ncbi:MAG: tetratricopeptide repeat protein [Coriobacteriia bacterium]|nr:tetratricopeptide repeat protein [Coriobacteriia bacterium]
MEPTIQKSELEREFERLYQRLLHQQGNDLALIFSSQGDYQKALAWYQKALVAREKVLGTDHPDTVSARSSIANIQAEQQGLT